MKVQIYHNPRCSKSRNTLTILEENDIKPEIVQYLNEPPTKSELKAILSMLGIAPRDLIRKGESEYKALGLDNESLSDEQLIEAMINTPKLIERPIVVVDNKKAVIGRPPEKVLSIIQ